MEEEQKPIIDRIKELENKVNLEGKKDKIVKKWGLPFKARVGKKKVKKNWVGVIRLNENKGIEMFKARIDEGVFEDKDKIPHIGTSDYIWNYKNKPVIIIPAGSTHPLSATQVVNETIEKQRTVHGFRLLANHLEKGQLDMNKKKFGMGPIVILLVLGAIGYFIYKSGAFT